MATRAGRGGQRRPGAGILRLSIVLVILILTFDKTVFLFRLAGAALRPDKRGRDYLAAMADCSSRRPVLLPLLTAESGDPEFLAAWIAAHLRRGRGRFRNKDTAPFVGRVTVKFPENILLDRLGFYEDGAGPRDWANFDPLFFRLARDPEFNALSFRALKEAFRDGRLQTDALPPLLSYLAWKNNAALADDLRDWAAGAGRTAETISASTGTSVNAAPLAGADPESVRRALAKALQVEASEIDLGPDLGVNDTPWEFVDMSRREPFAAGSFAGGPDAAAGPALRVMGFFAKNEPGKIPCRAGFSRRPAIPVGAKTYLFHFFYRTLGAAEQPSFWLAGPEFITEKEISPTHGAWRRVLYVFRNAELGIPEVEPHLRMWGTGTAWFAGIGLCKIEPRDPKLIAAREALFYE